MDIETYKYPSNEERWEMGKPERDLHASLHHFQMGNRHNMSSVFTSHSKQMFYKLVVKYKEFKLKQLLEGTNE